MTAAAQEQRMDGESALVQRARAGDMRAFEQLYREHAGRVHGLCLRLIGDRTSAEDCVQETFINAWRGLSRFETRSAFGTWLHRIAVNVVLTKRRRPSRWVDMPSETDTWSDMGWTFDTPVEVEELEAAIGELPDGARDVLVLCGLYGYSHPEAAQMLNVAEGTSKAQLHRARQLLREKLGLEED